ncbi:acyl-CoA synthetase [Microtetraspora sp. NBRC 13810]|uniref:fatty acyl-AMP ligase n=1 Tax=Microtetraspora sp. NBRC 13810 TaxID=3030990 RepID=UPI00249FFBAE|nr:fatty acyl-AMP ligase [Microtetraspora sp. NBRC 13810]GLW11239.1 acyl-CoA synthetase [Microtetraspora sp. NBRC 13810]
MVQTIPKTSTLTELIALRALESGPDVAYRFLPDGERETHALTFAELERKVRALAALLAGHTAPGDRALILAPDADDFIRGFLSCQYAGLVAVPVYPPLPFGGRQGTDTLSAIVRDCAPTVVIAAVPDEYRAFLLDGAPELGGLPWIDPRSAGEAEERAAEGFDPAKVKPEDVSFLQYTSGSTSLPKGVMVTHRALMHQEELLYQVGEFSRESVIVTWLPLFHDMGLIGNVLAGLYAGCQVVVMPPPAFIQRPARWLRAISKYRATVSGGPNFAYELSVRRVPPQDREGLDLSSLRIAFNGAEPVRAATLEAFTEAYRPHGLGDGVLFPCYGLAEVTLMATGSWIDAGPATLDVDLTALNDGRLVTGGDHRIVGSGEPRVHRRLEIVDPETFLAAPPGTVGEIWVAGPDVADGYWERPEETERTFGARIADTGEGPFLRTGDLGVLDGKELFVVGRLKDLIIVAGRNHYPQDVEAVAEAAHPLVRRGCSIAFGAEKAGAERLVVVAEIKPVHEAEELEDIRRAVRTAIASAHAVQPDEVILVAAGSVPKTSSGKLQRRACKAAWESGELAVVAVAEAGAAR